MADRIVLHAPSMYQTLGDVWRTIKVGFKSLWLHRLRSLLTVLGIVFGVCSVIAMLAVGEGRREPGWIAGLLESEGRSSAFAAAPARGLTLIGVDYPPDDELAARTLVTRDLRTR